MFNIIGLLVVGLIIGALARLIKQQDFRTRHKCAGDCQLLLLSPRQVAAATGPHLG